METRSVAVFGSSWAVEVSDPLVVGASVEGHTGVVVLIKSCNLPVAISELRLSICF